MDFFLAMLASLWNVFSAQHVSFNGTHLYGQQAMHWLSQTIYDIILHIWLTLTKQFFRWLVISYLCQLHRPPLPLTTCLPWLLYLSLFSPPSSNSHRSLFASYLYIFLAPFDLFSSLARSIFLSFHSSAVLFWLSRKNRESRAKQFQMRKTKTDAIFSNIWMQTNATVVDRLLAWEW